MIIALNQGSSITPTRLITPAMVRHWRYASECADVGGGLMVGTQLRIVELSKVAGRMWLRVAIPGGDPPKTLKIAGDEYAHNFRIASP